MEIRFTINGIPKGKARPRMTKTGHTYTPRATVDYENFVRECYFLQVGNKMLSGALEADIGAYFPIPKSAPKKLRYQMENENILYTHKPDCDNIVKIILDALNKTAYLDDSTISILNIRKMYSLFPRVEVYICELN